MEARPEPVDLAQFQGQEVEEERPLGFRRERDQRAAGLGAGLLVDVLEVGRLSAEARPVIDDLAIDLPRRVIDEGHTN